MKKKVLFFVIMIFSLSVLFAFGVNAETVDGINYTLKDGGTAIVATNSGASGEIVIPEKITVGENEYTVTEIGENAFNGNTKITKVTLPDTVKVIGIRAFRASSVQTVEISKNSQLETIRYYAFFNAKSLESIYLPRTFKTFEQQNNDGIFSGCSNLTTVTFDPGITNLRYIPVKTFYNCAKLTNITFPNSVEQIDSGCFYGCTSIGYINLGASFREFLYNNGAGHFNNRGLTTLVIPADINLDSIKANMFSSASTLKLKIIFTGTEEQYNAMAQKIKDVGNNAQFTSKAYMELQTVCQAFYSNVHLTPDDDGDCTTALVCERCGTVLLEAKEHNLVTVVVDATCTTDEMTHQYCTNEGCNYKTEPQKTADALGHNTTTTLTYANGFDANGEKVTVCSRCGYNETVVLNPIFKAKGYSVKEDGTAIMGGFTVNTEARDEYNTYAESALVYGAIFANVNDGSDITFDADNKITNEKAIQVEVIDQDYGAFNYTIKGFNLENATASTKFVITAYVIDNGNASFVQANKVGESAFEYTGAVNDGKLGFTTLTDIYASSEYAPEEEVVA